MNCAPRDRYNEHCFCAHILFIARSSPALKGVQAHITYLRTFILLKFRKRNVIAYSFDWRKLVTFEMLFADIVKTIFVFCTVMYGRMEDEPSLSVATAATVPVTIDNRDLTTIRTSNHNVNRDGDGDGAGGGDDIPDGDNNGDNNNDAADSEISLAPVTLSLSDSSSAYNWSTESSSVDTTNNDQYIVFSSSTVPRDRMGPFLNSHLHYLAHKDKLKSTEENNILRGSLVSVSSTSSPITETSLTHSVGAIAKPTKYHYYPHNQHMYLLPECAVQQVCSAVYVRLNYTQPLCACPSRYREPCSASLNSDDLHTTELSVDSKGKVLTLVKTCEPVKDMRLCRTPRDWSLLALQNVRTGKSHYLVICHCPESSILEGPTSHDQPTYASVPGIKVYGMVCIDKSEAPSLDESQVKRKMRLVNDDRRNVLGSTSSHANDDDSLTFPYDKLETLLQYAYA